VHPFRVLTNQSIASGGLRPPATLSQPFGLPQVSQLYESRLNGFEQAVKTGCDLFPLPYITALVGRFVARPKCFQRRICLATAVPFLSSENIVNPSLLI